MRSSFIVHRSSLMHGFTFIEIMIVVVIVGIVLALTVPKMKGTLQAAQIKAAAREVAGVLRIARDLAILRELPVQVQFDLEKDNYQINLLDASYHPMKETRRRKYGRKKDDDLSPGDDAGGVRRLPGGVHVQAVYTAAPLSDDKDLPRVIFYADGAASPATIALQDERQHAMSIELYRTTGMTRIENALPEKEPPNKRRYYGPNSKKN